MKIYETNDGNIKENEHGDLRVYKKTARNLDGWYDVSINHTYTLYANGYMRDEHLGRMVYSKDLTDYETRKQYAIKLLD